MNINHLFKHIWCLPSLLSNYDQMSDFWMFTDVYGWALKSSRRLLMNGPASTHIHKCTFSDKSVLTFSLKLSCSHALETHTNTHNSKPLPSFLLTASRLCSRHTPIVITSGLNYKLFFFFHHSLFWEEGNNFRISYKERPKRKRSEIKKKLEDEIRALLAFVEVCWGEKKKKSFLVSLYWWSHKSANTDAHTHTCTQQLR